MPEVLKFPWALGARLVAGRGNRERELKKKVVVSVRKFGTLSCDQFGILSSDET